MRTADYGPLFMGKLLHYVHVYSDFRKYLLLFVVVAFV
jgi:hypothetical protein